jgi:hypothetical protein
MYIAPPELADARQPSNRLKSLLNMALQELKSERRIFQTHEKRTLKQNLLKVLPVIGN